MRLPHRPANAGLLAMTIFQMPLGCHCERSAAISAPLRRWMTYQEDSLTAFLAARRPKVMEKVTMVQGK